MLGREGAVRSDKDRGAALCSLASSVHLSRQWNKHQNYLFVRLPSAVIAAREVELDLEISTVVRRTYDLSYS